VNKLFFFKDLDSHYVIYLFGIRVCIKHKCNFKCAEPTETGINRHSERNPRIIVSLTSYPARINTVYKTISTLLKQNLKPDKVILWLSKEQFPGQDSDLPETLTNLKQFGLEVEWVDEDIKSYKKIIPPLNKYPDDIIITADDDVYYSPNMVESLYNAYLNDPKNIYVKRSVKLRLNDNHLEGISSRKYFYKHLTEPSYFNQLMGGSGCLYPPHSLYKDITDLENIRATIPTHDDVYCWSMAVLNKTKIQVVGGFDENLYFVDGTQDVGLMHTNKKGQEGVSLEEAYEIMMTKYPQLLSILKEE